MRKILTAGILVLGSLGSVQASATTVSAPILEFLGYENASESKIVAAEQKFRDGLMLARELEQLQVLLKNLKRASPKLWDGSLNAFENLANATASIDTIANAVKDADGLLKRSGCTNALYETARDEIKSTSPQQPNYNIDITAGAGAGAQVEEYQRGQLGRRCKQLLTKLETEEQIQAQAKKEKEELEKKKKDLDGGTAKGLDNITNELVQMRVQMMQDKKDLADESQAEIMAKIAEAERQKAMHDRLMRAPSSRKKAKDPTLTVDPRNY